MAIRPGRWIPFLVAFFASGCASAPARPKTVARGDYAMVGKYVSSLARYLMKKQDVVGLSIALVDDQRIVWAEGFGYADKARNIPASPEAVYRAGSISKLFTATAAMQLAERGKMDIDRPLDAYLPGFSIRTRFADTAPITPRSIMTHHSGLPSDYRKGMWTRNPEPFTRVAGFVRDEYAVNPPGSVFSYSNLGMTLLGDAVPEAVKSRRSDYTLYRTISLNAAQHAYIGLYLGADLLQTETNSLAITTEYSDD